MTFADETRLVPCQIAVIVAETVDFAATQTTDEVKAIFVHLVLPYCRRFPIKIIQAKSGLEIMVVELITRLDGSISK